MAHDKLEFMKHVQKIATHWLWRGFHHSAVTKHKIRLVQLGRKASPSTRRKMSVSQTRAWKVKLGTR